MRCDNPECQCHGSLKKLVQPQNPSSYNFPDTPKLKLILNKAGYDASLADLEWAWLRHSDSMCAQWLTVNSSESNEVVSALLEHLIPAP
jgi:hypothetical protein